MSWTSVPSGSLQYRLRAPSRCVLGRMDDFNFLGDQKRVPRVYIVHPVDDEPDVIEPAGHLRAPASPGVTPGCRCRS